VNTIDRVAADPQIRHRGMVLALEAEDGRRIEVMGDPFFMQETRRRSHSYPPIAGEHTTAILGELLGLGSEEIASLIDSGAVLPAGRATTSTETD
jgi:crotonobetainyl-CoA:carnitine CoA-transferase CaiB-like acyl-CoA transferase